MSKRGKCLWTGLFILTAVAVFVFQTLVKYDDVFWPVVVIGLLLWPIIVIVMLMLCNTGRWRYWLMLIQLAVIWWSVFAEDIVISVMALAVAAIPGVVLFVSAWYKGLVKSDEESLFFIYIGVFVPSSISIIAVAILFHFIGL